MGGEITAGQPTGKVKAEPATTVAQAIEQFARSSRSSPSRDRPRHAESVHGALVDHRARGAGHTCRISGVALAAGASRATTA